MKITGLDERALLVRRSVVNTLCDRVTVGVVIFILGAAAFLIGADRTWQGRNLAAFVAGRPVSYQAPSIVRIPEGQSWELAKVQVRNRSEQPVTVVGYQQACGAAAKEVFPCRTGDSKMKKVDIRSRIGNALIVIGLSLGATLAITDSAFADGYVLCETPPEGGCVNAGSSCKYGPLRHQIGTCGVSSTNICTCQPL